MHGTKNIKFANPITLRLILILSSRSRLRLPSSLFTSGAPNYNLYWLLFCTTCVTCPAYLLILDLTTLIELIISEENKSWSSSICNLHQAPIASLSLSLSSGARPSSAQCSSLSVCNQVSHPHKTGEVTSKHKCIRKKAEEIKAIRTKLN